MSAPPAPRTDLRHYASPWLPPELVAFASPKEQAGLGRTGAVGLLELEFARRAEATRLVHHFQQTPLQILRPLRVDPRRPGMAFVYLVHVGGGIMQGDRYRLDVVCRAGAEVHVTTQASTKLYRMERDYATQVVNLTVEADALLEYLPDAVIPFRGARFGGYTRLTVDPTATAILGEVLLSGRVAHGERHCYDLVCGRTEAYGLDGRLLFADTIKLQPGAALLASPGRFGPYDVLGTLYVVARAVEPRRLAERLSPALCELDAAVAGASELPNGCGVSVRVLGHTSAAVRAAIRTAWNEARLALLGTPAPDLRKG